MSNTCTQDWSSTVMASLPRKESRIHRLRKCLRRVVNRVRDAINSSTLPGTSTLNIPNDADVKAPEMKGTRCVNDPHTSTNTDTPLITVSPLSSHPEPNTSDKFKKSWDMTRSVFETGLRLLEKSADAFPPLKSTVGGLVACLDLAQVGYGRGFNNLTLSHSHRSQSQIIVKNTKNLLLNLQIWRTL